MEAGEASGLLCKKKAFFLFLLLGRENVGNLPAPAGVTIKKRVSADVFGCRKATETAPRIKAKEVEKKKVARVAE